MVTSHVWACILAHFLFSFSFFFFHCFHCTDAAAIFALHEAVRDRSVDRTLGALLDPFCHVTDVRSALAREYLDNLIETLATVEADGAKASKWKQCNTADGRVYYYNEESKLTQWVAPIDEEVLMTLDEVCMCVYVRICVCA